MAQVRVALGAEDLGTAHEHAVVVFGGDVFLRGRGREAGPAGAGIELFVAAEERGTAADAAVDALLVVVPVLPGEGALGALLARDGELFGCQILLPLGIALDDFA